MAIQRGLGNVGLIGGKDLPSRFGERTGWPSADRARRNPDVRVVPETLDLAGVHKTADVHAPVVQTEPHRSWDGVARPAEGHH